MSLANVSFFKRNEVECLKSFEKSLKDALIITKPHEEIKTFFALKPYSQNLFIAVQLLWMMPRLFLLCFLYSFPNEFASVYRLYLADYFEELGLVGRSMNICYVLFMFFAFLDTIIIRYQERTGSLKFLTDILDLQHPDHKLDEEARQELLSKFKTKIILKEIVSLQTRFSVHTYDVVGITLFLWKKPPMWICIEAIVWFGLIYKVSSINTVRYFNTYLSYVLTTDYLICKIEMIEKKIGFLSSNPAESELLFLVHLIDDLKQKLRVYNAALKILFRNMMYIFRGGVSSLFFVSMINMNPWLKIVTVLLMTGLSLCIMTTAMYVSQIDARIVKLYHRLQTLSVNISSAEYTQKHIILSYKSKFVLKTIIKELGTSNLNNDGHFVIGLSDGTGPAISRMEIFELTLETIFNTLMLIQISKHLNR
jgi:hypothetical protein